MLEIGRESRYDVFDAYIPVHDLLEIGTGGGSIASIDGLGSARPHCRVF